MERYVFVAFALLSPAIGKRLVLACPDLAYTINAYIVLGISSIAQRALFLTTKSDGLEANLLSN
jgi:hypothetical protein